MASIRDTLTKLLASDKPEPGTPLANYIGQYPFQQGEAPLEAPMLSPDDLIGTGIGKAALISGAKFAPLLMGAIKPHINTQPLVSALKNVSIQDKAFNRLANNYPEMVPKGLLLEASVLQYLQLKNLLLNIYLLAGLMPPLELPY